MTNAKLYVFGEKISNAGKFYITYTYVENEIPGGVLIGPYDLIDDALNEKNDLLNNSKLEKINNIKLIDANFKIKINL